MKARLVLVFLIIAALLVAALPALANHQWSLVSAFCDSTTQTVTFVSTNEGGESPGYWIDFYVGVDFLETVQFFSDDPPYPDAGSYSLSYTNPAFSEGAVVQVVDSSNETSIEVTCAPSTGKDDCPNPLPAGFLVRSIPAGAPAYFAPREGATTGFSIPPGTWYTRVREDGFVEVWIACGARNVYVPAANVVG